MRSSPDRDLVRRLGIPLIRLDSTTSTMDEIRHREPGAPEGLTVVADQQTAGRGRMGRTWRDEPGQSLLFSTLLRPDCEPADFRLFPVAAGLAVARAVAECYAIEANVKWPNDVLIEDRKVAGILVTTRIGEGRIMSATIG
ncbi:MAG: biotin--[acetyl-CoA-carboxylase] ligase, partial [Thermomicrobiales bacterium]|nr:biotin--[acetyl-CoA-carboxylase] ligase [Thermomicrobiales bacterium]